MSEKYSLLKLIFSPKNWKKPLRKETAYPIYALKKFLHVLVFSGRQFMDKKCYLHMGALAFYSLLSIVPVIAMGFAIAKSFGLENYLEDRLQDLSNQYNREFLGQILTFSTNMLNRTKGGIIAGVGVFVLLWSVISVLNNIEKSFNDIWGIKTGRKWLRKLTDYITIIILFPILLIASFSTSVYINNFIQNLIYYNNFTKNFEFLAIILLHAIPILAISVLITLVFMIIPNTKVKVGSAIYAGLFTGIFFELFQFFYIHYQLKLTSYNAIYGSFAALPFFFLWIYYSWGIVLFGMNIVVQHVNFKNSKASVYPFELNVSQSRFLSLLVLFEIIKNFKKENNKPLEANKISLTLDISYQNIIEILNTLIKANLILPVIKQDQNVGYTPAFCIKTYTIENVFSHLDNRNPDKTFDKFYNKKNFLLVKKKTDALQKSVREDKNNILLEDFIDN